MPSHEFVMNVSKLVIAAAWADGEMDNSEINALKDMLFAFPNLSDQDWHILNMYIDTPVSKEDAEKLLGSVLNEIRTPEEREFVISTLTGLFEADGKITDEEQELLEKIKADISGKSTGLFAHVNSFLKGAVKNRVTGSGSSLEREERIDDYLKNGIYFQLVNRMKSAGKQINLVDEDIRKLCLAAGLLARVAWIDKVITEEESENIKLIISESWEIPEEEAQLIAEISISQVAKGLDYFRLTRNFFENTTSEERKGFLKILFRIANTDNTSLKEIEEIRVIASHLHIDHKDFIEAKLSISDEDRGGF
jgi:uncharacterized tellurite resistance protein B-like protein